MPASYGADYDHDFAQINAHGDAPDLNKMQATCDRILTKWKAINPSAYIDLTCETCEVLSSIEFGDSQQYIICQKYALDALGQGLPITIDEQYCLVVYGLSHDFGIPGPIAGTPWTTRRTILTVWWLKTWQRISDGIIPGFDQRQYPFGLSVMPPFDPHQLMYSGMSYKAIGDPKIRAEYKAALDKNVQNMNTVLQQRDVTELIRVYKEEASEYLLNAYTTGPKDTTELTTLMQQYEIPKANQDKILATIAQSTGQPLPL